MRTSYAKKRSRTEWKGVRGERERLIYRLDLWLSGSAFLAWPFFGFGRSLTRSSTHSFSLTSRLPRLLLFACSFRAVFACVSFVRPNRQRTQSRHVLARAHTGDWSPWAQLLPHGQTDEPIRNRIPSVKRYSRTLSRTGFRLAQCGATLDCTLVGSGLACCGLLWCVSEVW